MIANVYNIHICGIIVFLKIVKYNQVYHFEGGDAGYTTAQLI